MADTQDHLGDYQSRRTSRSVSRREPLTILFTPFATRSAPVEDDGFRSLVEREIVPRLRGVRGRGGSARLQPAPTLAAAADNEITACSDWLLVSDCGAVRDRIEALRLQGRSLEGIFLDVLAPTASHLRQLWAEDLCGFAEVTLAVLNLQAVVRHFAPAFCAEGASLDLIEPALGRRALLAAPRNGLDVGTTMFGLMMVSEFFRRSQWDTWIEPDLASPAFAAAVRDHWFDVVELLVPGDKNLDGVASGIKAIRRGSPNRSIGVVVCGQVFVEHPEFVRLVGADLTSSDPRSSVIQAQDLVLPTTPPVRLR